MFAGGRSRGRYVFRACSRAARAVYTLALGCAPCFLEAFQGCALGTWPDLRGSPARPRDLAKFLEDPEGARTCLQEGAVGAAMFFTRARGRRARLRQVYPRVHPCLDEGAPEGEYFFARAAGRPAWFTQGLSSARLASLGHTGRRALGT